MSATPRWGDRMAIGGNSGDLDRLQDQVDATRTELAEVAGAINGLTELVTDLIRRSSSDRQDDRWHARLGSLETRLEMLETGIRGEVERMRATAGAVDALADDFRSTVGDTHTLIELAASLGDRVGMLASLERQVRGAAQDMAKAVEARLDQQAATAQRREGLLGDRIEGAIDERVGQLRSATDEQAERLESSLDQRLEQAERTLGSTVQRVEATVGELESGLERANASLTEQVGRLEGALADRVG